MIRVYIVLCLALASATTAVEVSTSLGAIRGATLKSRLGNDFHAFRGIRYAKPPIGALRFKSPQPVDPWKPEVFDATDDGPMCPQYPFNSTAYSEDCLRLNVYTKSLDTKASKPVVIYIHSGGLYVFSGQSKIFAGPQFLMDRDIVLVTINYRLGTLGFLATGTADALGNAGLKDQVLAIKWVRDHIRKFGGDPNSVTLFGYSAGSLSVGLHMASPMSKGLFHRAVAMSSSPVSQVQYTTDQLDVARKQAGMVNCPTNNVNAMVKCLRETPADEFVRTQEAMFEYEWILVWRPVIEKDLGQERFLIEDPTISYQTGRIERVPIIIGMTKDEFVQIGNDILRNETLVQLLNNDWNKLAPGCFQYERDTPKSREVSTVLRREYLDNKPLRADEPFDKLGTLANDAVIKFGVHRFAHLAARYVPVYYYSFSYQGRYSHFPYPDDKPYGVAHQDDLMYLIHLSYLTPIYKKTDPENTTIERLTRILATFAAHGNPNNPNDEYLKNVNWEQLDLKKENYLDIGSELVPRTRLELDRLVIWQKLFPLDWTDKPCKHSHGSLDYPEPSE